MTTLRILAELGRLMVSASLGTRQSLMRAGALEAMVIIMGVAGPYALKLLIDALDGRAGNALHLSFYVVAFVGCWAGASIVETARLACTADMVEALTRRFTIDALGSTLPAITAARDSKGGRVPGMLERLPFSLTLVVEGLLWRMAPVVLQAVASLAVVAGLIPPRYVLILAATLGGFIVATWIGAVWHRIHADATNAAASGVSGTIGDLVRNARRVVLNGALDRELLDAQSILSVKRGAAQRMYRSLTVMAVLQFGIVGLGLTVLLLFAGLDVAQGRMTTGDFILLQTYAFRLTVPLSSLGYILAQAGVAIANIRDVMGLRQVAVDDEGLPPTPVGSAEVRLRAASFFYGEGMPGISDISVRIGPGRFVAIVGPNGSGKSRLAQIMAGVLTPISGKVEVAGVDIATIPWRERHRYVLYAPQFIGLFNRSLRDNVLYPPTTRQADDVEALLRRWRFHESGRPLDLDLELGEQGERLSGGQIQKLELARLAGVQVPILILDESTSALDPRSEAAAIATLRRRTDDATTLIMITHRLETAQAADQVLFMRGGRLAASGLHEELMDRDASYRELWDMVAPSAQSTTVLDGLGSPLDGAGQE
ncbi:ATP-binding cassette domain-containing protein [Sphingobium cupriresistens]|uniref:ABC transporter ATP-binding protein n=1 Tax=Sphingobium cupriresistens TaxID=1132417 RepID=A0A8G1ZFT4_9SPHN|nr:ABC transporter ATP-binding protein [Sphingobium cupriresistens]RYM10663.1 ABC transporter ATP-binding protein [Sphingobium cupriresistens]